MNMIRKNDKIVGRKIAPLMLAIISTLAVVSLSAARSDTTSKVYGSDLFMQAQQTQPGSEPMAPVNTTFTYQGRLKDGANPANGQYDFEFRLFDSLTAGTQVGSTLSRSNLTVSEGLVTVSLTFGAAFQGQMRFLEVAVRPVGGGSYTTLSPRQQVSAAPYAMGVRAGTTITNTGGVVARFAANAFEGVFGSSSGLSTAGVRGESINGDGVHGTTTGDGDGVRGESANGYGVSGSTDGGEAGVHGRGHTGVLGVGVGLGNVGVRGRGVLAGLFEGDVEIEDDLQVSGNLSKGSGSFKIDHPLDPGNKYLYHSFVESPDMMNIYNGNATLDAKGEATVVLPEWFGALNKEFRYQLTAVGAPGPNLYISKKVENNRFSIAGGSADMEVSWQVTGIRKDAYAEKHRIAVEEDKGEDRGKYLHPEEHGQPENKGIRYEELPKIKEQP